MLFLLAAVALASEGARPAAADERRIPRTIYQTWMSKLIPLSFQIVRSRMLARNPGYKVVMFDDSDVDSFVSKHWAGTDVARAFFKLKVGAARADLWRYLVLFREGGIYLDLDAEIVVNLDEFIRPGDGAVVSREPTPHFMVQYMLAFEAGHPVLARAIELSTRSILDGPHMPEGDERPKDPWLLHPTFYLAGPPVFCRAVDIEARTTLGRAAPWSVWDATDAEVNPGLGAPPLRMRMVGTHYDRAVVPEVEFGSQRYWFASGWRTPNEWGGNDVALYLGVGVVAVAAFLFGTRTGRTIAILFCRSRFAVPCFLFAGILVLGWLILRGFIQVL